MKRSLFNPLKLTFQTGLVAPISLAAENPQEGLARGVKTVRFLLLALLFFTPIASVHAAPLQMLNWKNHDVLSGNIVSATKDHLTWKSEIFKDSTEINLGVLKTLSFPRDLKKRITTEPFLIQLKNGDRLYGDIKKIDDTTVTISSARFSTLNKAEEMTLIKNTIQEITHLKRSQLLPIPTISNWSSFSKTKKKWREISGNRLQTTQKNVDLFWETTLPDSMEIELILTWSQQLDFSFGFGVPSNHKGLENLPRIESWEGSLVLTHADDFEILIDEIDQSKKRLRLSIIWENKKNLLKVFDEFGKKLCEINIPEKIKWVKSGIFIANKKGDLTIETLRISKATKGFDSTKRCLLNKNGEVLLGEIKSFDGKVWTVENDEKTSSLPASDFRRAILNFPKAEKDHGDFNTFLRFQDGSLIKGSLVSSTSQKISIQTEYSEEPLICDLNGAAEISFHLKDSSSKEKPPHVMYLKKSRLLGELRSGSGKPGDILRWKIVGAKNTSRIRQADAKIILLRKGSKKKNTAKNSQLEQWPDTLYFVNRDMIPCRITSIDQQNVYFDSFSESSSVSHKEVKAIDFGTLGFSKISTKDSLWEFENKLEKNNGLQKEQLLIQNFGRFGHPSLMLGDQLDFDVSWKKNSYFYISLLPFISNNLLTSVPDIQLDYIVYGTSMSQKNQRSIKIPLKGGKAHFTLKSRKGTLSIFINGKLINVIKFSRKNFLGRGLAFEIDKTDHSLKNKPHVTFKNFIISNRSEGGSSFLVNEEKKKHLLTIPRLKKEDPPKHILCSNNGDLLRGEITSLDENKIHFRTGMVDFVFSRKKITNIVWLHAEKIVSDDSKKVETKIENKVAESNLQTAQILFKSGQRITIQATGWKSNQLIGISSILGKCKIPLDHIRELRMGTFADKSTDVPYSDWVAIPAQEPKIAAAGSGNSGSSSPLIGTAAKDFKIVRIDGTSKNLSDLHGKIVVLDFWATWCGPCIQALPQIIAATSSFKPDEVVFAAVNQGEESDTIQEFIQGRKLKVIPALDPDGEIGSLFNVEGIPQTVIIDASGIIRFVHVGASPNLKEDLIKQIKSLQKDSTNTEEKEAQKK